MSLSMNKSLAIFLTLMFFTGFAVAEATETETTLDFPNEGDIIELEGESFVYFVDDHIGEDVQDEDVTVTITDSDGEEFEAESYSVYTDADNDEDRIGVDVDIGEDNLEHGEEFDLTLEADYTGEDGEEYYAEDTWEGMEAENIPDFDVEAVKYVIGDKEITVDEYGDLVDEEFEIETTEVEAHYEVDLSEFDENAEETYGEPEMFVDWEIMIDDMESGEIDITENADLQYGEENEVVNTEDLNDLQEDEIESGDEIEFRLNPDVQVASASEDDEFVIYNAEYQPDFQLSIEEATLQNADSDKPEEVIMEGDDLLVTANLNTDGQDVTVETQENEVTLTEVEEGVYEAEFEYVGDYLQLTVEATDDSGNAETETTNEVEEYEAPEFGTPEITLGSDSGIDVDVTEGNTDIIEYTGEMVDDTLEIDESFEGVQDSSIEVEDAYGELTTFNVELFVDFPYEYEEDESGTLDEQHIRGDATIGNSDSDGEVDLEVTDLDYYFDQVGFEVLDGSLEGVEPYTLGIGEEEDVTFVWDVDMLELDSIGDVQAGDETYNLDEQDIVQEMTIAQVNEDGNTPANAYDVNEFNILVTASGEFEDLTGVDEATFVIDSSLEEEVEFEGSGEFVTSETETKTEQNLDKQSDTEEQHFLDITEKEVMITEDHEDDISGVFTIDVESDMTDTISTDEGMVEYEVEEVTKEILETKLHALEETDFNHTLDEQEVQRTKDVNNTGDHDLQNILVEAPDFLDNDYSDEEINLEAGEGWSQAYVVAGDWLAVYDDEVENEISASFTDVKVEDEEMQEQLGVEKFDIDGSEETIVANDLFGIGDNITGDFTEDRSGVGLVVGVIIGLALIGLFFKRQV